MVLDTMWKLLVFACLAQADVAEEACDSSTPAFSSGLLQRASPELLKEVAPLMEHFEERIMNEIEKRLDEKEGKDHAERSKEPVEPPQKNPELFQGCSARSSRKFRATSSLVRADEGENVTHENNLGACSADQISLRRYSKSNTFYSCCPVRSLQCAGCAQFSGSSCEYCAGGFLKRGATCVACADSAGWLNLAGKTCAQLSSGECNDVKVKGQSSNEACCKCSGGHVTPTPFAYEAKHLALGSWLYLAPRPPTAARYSVDQGCDLSGYNLTLDGGTGSIWVAWRKSPPSEAFSIECIVTAHQAPGVVYEAPVSISMDYLSYGVPLLLFSTSSLTFSPQKAPGAWKDFAVTCAPLTGWLQVNAASGQLTRGSNSNSVGAVDTEDGTLAGQNGGVCVVTGWHQAVGSTKWEQRKAKILALWPQPWPSMAYEATQVSVTLGEQLPLLKLVPHHADGMLKPTDFKVACMGSTVNQYFDELLGVYLVEGYSVLEVTPEGALSIFPDRGLSAVFDSMASSGSVRKKITLSCSVWGVFPDTSLAPIKAPIQIDILDDICWEQKNMKWYHDVVSLAGSEAACRSWCRDNAGCAGYVWVSSQCRSHYNHPKDGVVVSVNAKVTDCTAEMACMEVAHSDWYKAGNYCPVAPDLFHNDVLYRKDGLTPEETIYMAKYLRAVDGAVSGCTDGDWILRRVDPQHDFLVPDSGEVELRGQTLGCVAPSSGVVEFGVASCGQPANITVGEEGENPFVLDDPVTNQPADFTLHPCECAPDAWGMEPPVNPESFEAVPGRSGNRFIPPPFQLVSGQFVCPARGLLDNGVHVETDTEAMERSDCEARCKAASTCNFFWHGSQQGSNTCRLYASCDHLVQELGLEGRLDALPREQSCQIADPEKCFATTVRRAYLTSAGDLPFRYANLHVQCDQQLLLGSGGVEECARPTYRDPASHEWQHKSLLPQTFLHGDRLDVSCWGERYSALYGVVTATSTRLTCVNGQWFNWHNEPGIGKFGCYKCVQVGASGYKEIEERNEQEIWFFNRMRLALSTEVLDRSVNQAHCLKFGTNGDDLVLQQQADCPANMIAEFTGTTASDSRLVKLLEGSNQCMEQTMAGEMAIAVHRTCDASRTAQQVPMADLGGMMWRIHTFGHEKAGHRLSPKLIDCIGRGAVGKVDMEHLFNTNPGQIATFYGRATLPGFINGRLDGGWKDFGMPFSDAGTYPSATKMRICLTWTDSGHGGTYLRVKLGRRYGESLFEDSYVGTWSAQGITHHKCGPWHARVTCGWVWETCCKAFVTHSSGVSGVVKDLEIEYGSDDPTDARTFRGVTPIVLARVGDLLHPAWNVWYQMNDKLSFHLQSPDYSSATHIRGCLTWTDSAQSGTLKIRLKLKESPSVFFEDSYGITWSASGLLKHRCGAWHALSGIQCGTGFGSSCKLEYQVTSGADTKIFAYDFQYKSSNSESLTSAFMGRMSTDVHSMASWAGASSSWHKVSRTTGFHINTASYPTATEFRLCAMFSDYSGGGGGMKLRIRRTDAAGYTTFVEENYGLTWSGGGLIHYKCGAWREVSSLSCGVVWGDTCQIDMIHEQGVGVDLYGADIEYKALLPRDVCRFAPVISQLEPQQVELFKMTSWPSWQFRLADGPVYCPDGRVLTDLDMRGEHLLFKCGVVAGLGSCMEGYTPNVDVRDWASFEALGSLKVVCNQDALLNGFHFEFSAGGNWARFRYTCCKAAGAPVALVKRGPLPMATLDGVYCPVHKDASGRLGYRQQLIGTQALVLSTSLTGRALALQVNSSSHAGANSSELRATEAQQTLSPKMLTFDPLVGKWCVEADCASVDGRVVPIGLSGAGWDAVEASDFDGKFEGTGVPKQKGDTVKELAGRLRAIKTPKRPKQPPQPKLEGYTPEEPTYAAECVDYGELWKSIQESYKDETGQVTPHMNKLEAEPAYQLPEEHPCFVAGNVSAIRGIIGGGDGGDTGTQMNYVELDGCAARATGRAVETARLERDHAIYETMSDVFYESMDLICDTPPNIEAAPLGVGTEVQPEDWCTDAADFAKAMTLYTNFNVGIGFAISKHKVEQEDGMDCDPLQASIDRLFCDIHCVRDAVVRGDRAILRNLKAATDISNNNMRKMAEWGVAANKAETGWLAAKMDTVEERLSIRIQMMQATLDAQNGGSLIEAKELSRQMLTEISGFAQAASFNALSRNTARDALERFAKGAQVLAGPANASRAAAAFGQLSSLYHTLQGAGGGSRLAALGAEFRREAEVLQEVARKELQVLGVYKEHGNITSAAVRTRRQETLLQEQHAALIAVDRIWWELRGKLDEYLEVAELQVAALQTSLRAMASYEHCASGLKEVQRSYAASLAGRDRGHAALRAAWRESTRLIGELAAVVVDGGIFATFVKAEGCHSTLAKQTFQQARHAVGGMRLLLHRFQVGGLGQPDLSPLVQATRRLQRSFQSSREACISSS